ncbi:MAG: hypothetical protein FJ034_07140 [Chloroflexi bacterium]|nr:hypothetical protein [Chloroflexota bacterium]
MPYLSQIQYRTVLEPNGSTAGRLVDLAVPGQAPGTPTVQWAVLATPEGERVVPWSEVFAEVTHFRLRHLSTSLPPVHLAAGTVRLARDLFDREIRQRGMGRAHLVSDVQLEENGGHLRLVGLDVGLRGLLRRAGIEGLAERVAGVVGRRVPVLHVAWPEVER